MLALIGVTQAQLIVEIYNKLGFYNETTNAKSNEFEMFNFRYTENVSLISYKSSNCLNIERKEHQNHWPLLLRIYL